MSDTVANLEEALPLKLIRQHTKSDDDLRVDDSLLSIYRNAAIEAAEVFTGRVWAGLKTISEHIGQIMPPSRFKKPRPIKLQYPVYDGLVTLTGGKLANPVQILTSKGSRKIIPPILSMNLEGSCCNPCGADFNSGIIATYKTGVNGASDIPNGVFLGCLIFFAWQIGNPGYQLMTMADSSTRYNNGISGTNNAIFASGAAEQWRVYRRV